MSEVKEHIVSESLRYVKAEKVDFVPFELDETKPLDEAFADLQEKLISSTPLTMMGPEQIRPMLVNEDYLWSKGKEVHPYDLMNCILNFDFENPYEKVSKHTTLQTTKKIIELKKFVEEQDEHMPGFLKFFSKS